MLLQDVYPSVCRRHYSIETANGGVECMWGMKNRHFRPLSRFTLEIIQDRHKPRDAIVTMQGTRTGSIKWCHFQRS